MKSLHDKTFTHESVAYRKARNELLESEIALRRQTEKVAEMRRKLPMGGKLKEDYEFIDADGKNVKLSSLFEKGKDTLALYSMMFEPTWHVPCIMCNSIVDGLNGNARQITQKINLAVIGKAPIEKLTQYAKEAGWQHVRLLSSSDNSYNVDYFGEVNCEQDAIMNIFVKKTEGIYHTWGAEMKFVPGDPGQDHRLLDIIWPLYNVLDLTPEGREDFYPKVQNDKTESSSCNCGDCDCK